MEAFGRQGTVFSFDPATAEGSIILDDGVRLPFPAQALHGSGLRLLRPGQRVRLVLAQTAEGPAVEKVQIITMT